jgi:Ser/Thr protein kinase RdoA (MazF antagonist)
MYFIFLLIGASLFSSLSGCEEKVFDLKASEVAVVTSLVDSSTISKIVEKYYDFDGSVKVSILSIGINDIYLIESEGKKHVLRLSRGDKYLTLSASEFQFELEWLEFLHQNEVPVSYPIRRLDNQLYGLIEAPEGPRFFTLFSYAEGTVDMNADQAFILGKAVAQLHVTSDKFKTPLNRNHLSIDALMTDSIKRIKDFIGETDPKSCALLNMIAENLTEEISRLDLDSLNYGIIGGDFHGKNQHFTQDNHLTLFDFEFCAHGYRVYDIATFKWNRSSTDTEIWQSFLEGYQSVRKLSDSELKAIALFVKLRNLWWMGMRVTLSESKHKLDAKFWEYAFSRFNLALYLVP